MIIYEGIVKRGKVNYLIFKNDKDYKVEIPIDDSSAHRISLYLDKIAPNNSKNLYHYDDGLSD